MSSKYTRKGRGRNPKNAFRGGFTSRYSGNNSREGITDTSQKSSASDNEEPFDWAAALQESDRQHKLKFAHFSDIIKNVYRESASVAALSKEQVADIRYCNNNTTLSYLDGSECREDFNPVSSFEEVFFLYPQILKLIKDCNFENPSPIQSQLWPVLMSGKDAVGIAQTGTGKTLGFLLPVLLHIAAQPPHPHGHTGPFCLIMAPTRELAQQIHKEAQKFPYCGIRSVCVYGQGNRAEQLKALTLGAEIIVATPGRLLDFVSRNELSVTGVSFLVLDEADRMLDMGFQPDILRVISGIRPDCQICLTSATFLSDVQYIANKLMKNAVMIRVGDLDLAAVGTVTQYVEVCEEDEKLDKVLNHLKNLAPEEKVIVFANRKTMVTHLSTSLVFCDIDARVMHGGLEQSDREEALDMFHKNEVQILVATDVASRGLDVKNITKVINFDLPKNLEEYVHRAGRTGRAGATGEVLTYVTWQNRDSVRELIQILKRTNQEVPHELQRLADRAARYPSRASHRFGSRHTHLNADRSFSQSCDTHGSNTESENKSPGLFMEMKLGVEHKKDLQASSDWFDMQAPNCAISSSRTLIPESVCNGKVEVNCSVPFSNDTSPLFSAEQDLVSLVSEAQQVEPFPEPEWEEYEEVPSIQLHNMTLNCTNNPPVMEDGSLGQRFCQFEKYRLNSSKSNINHSSKSRSDQRNNLASAVFNIDTSNSETDKGNFTQNDWEDSGVSSLDDRFYSRRNARKPFQSHNSQVSSRKYEFYPNRRETVQKSHGGFNKTERPQRNMRNYGFMEPSSHSSSEMNWRSNKPKGNLCD